MKIIHIFLILFYYPFTSLAMEVGLKRAEITVGAETRRFTEGVRAFVLETEKEDVRFGAFYSFSVSDFKEAKTISSAGLAVSTDEALTPKHALTSHLDIGCAQRMGEKACEFYYFRGTWGVKSYINSDKKGISNSAGMGFQQVYGKGSNYTTPVAVISLGYTW